MDTFNLGNFAPLKKDELIGLNGRTRLTIRCTKPALAFHSFLDDFTDETMLGGGAIQFEINAPSGYIRLSCAGRIWVDFNSAQQKVVRMTDEVYTTLDRPAPLSPEMAAIQRLMRQNEIAREQDRDEMLRSLQRHEQQTLPRNDADGSPSSAPKPVAAETTSEVVKKPEPNDPDPTGQKDETPGESRDPAALSE